MLIYKHYVFTMYVVVTCRYLLPDQGVVVTRLGVALTFRSVELSRPFNLCPFLPSTKRIWVSSTVGSVILRDLAQAINTEPKSKEEQKNVRMEKKVVAFLKVNNNVRSRLLLDIAKHLSNWGDIPAAFVLLSSRTTPEKPDQGPVGVHDKCARITACRESEAVDTADYKLGRHLVPGGQTPESIWLTTPIFGPEDFPNISTQSRSANEPVSIIKSFSSRQRRSAGKEEGNGGIYV